jgi:membrane protein YqaA with SNARE-associated domain
VAEFDTVIWEGGEEDEGDELRLLYSSELDIVALQDVTHDVTVLLEPSTMASLSGAFLTWAQGSSLN